jgi:hypothetical protein
MDFHGTDKDDVIDQARLGLPDQTHFYGGDGNDTIIFSSSHAVGGRGNDKLVGTSNTATVAYWGAVKGVKVNLATGFAEDSFGGIDELVNIHVVHASSYDDYLVGSNGNDIFAGLGGNDTIIGGGGADEVVYFGLNSADVKITYDVPSDTFTVVRNAPSGDKGIDTLKGISIISFAGAGSDSVKFYKDQFVPISGFLRLTNTVAFNPPPNTHISQIKAGDVNGDGNIDFYIALQVSTGTAPTPVVFMLGDGKGTFSDGTSSVFPNGPALVIGGGRAVSADFNKDGRTDIFQFDFGNDAPPFPGGINHLFLSSVSENRLRDASNTLGQKPALNHAGSAGDVNGDGYLDVLVNTLNFGNLLYLNDKSGHFVERPDLLPKFTVPLYGSDHPQTNTTSAVIDVNGDGHNDLILGKWDGDSSTRGTQVLLNDGTGNFANSVPINLPSSGLAAEIVLDIKAIDLNGDAKADLMLSVTTGAVGNDASAFYTTPYVQLLVNDGGGHFHDETAIRLPKLQQDSFGTGWFIELQSADFNHDGYSDIFASSFYGLSSAVLMNRGDGTFYKDWSSAKDGRSTIGDVNGDGATDIISITPRDAYILLNQRDSGHVYKANFGGDNLIGSSAGDKFYSNDGADVIDGGGGLDSAYYVGKYRDYWVGKSGNAFTVADKTSASLADKLTNIERVHFSDTSLALDINGPAAGTYRLYQAAFDRKPDLEGLGYWIAQVDKGLGFYDVAWNFINSTEFTTLYGMNVSNDAFIAALYDNVLHRVPDQAGFDYWTQLLSKGTVSRHAMLAEFSESPENQAQVIGSITNGVEYQQFIG